MIFFTLLFTFYLNEKIWAKLEIILRIKCTFCLELYSSFLFFLTTQVKRLEVWSVFNLEVFQFWKRFGFWSILILKHFRVWNILIFTSFAFWTFLNLETLFFTNNSKWIPAFDYRNFWGPASEPKVDSDWAQDIPHLGLDCAHRQARPRPRLDLDFRSNLHTDLKRKFEYYEFLKFEAFRDFYYWMPNYFWWTISEFFHIKLLIVRLQNLQKMFACCTLLSLLSLQTKLFLICILSTLKHPKEKIPAVPQIFKCLTSISSNIYKNVKIWQFAFSTS